MAETQAAASIEINDALFCQHFKEVVSIVFWRLSYGTTMSEPMTLVHEL